jgi:hypothetical protein
MKKVCGILWTVVWHTTQFRGAPLTPEVQVRLLLGLVDAAGQQEGGGKVLLLALRRGPEARLGLLL